MAKHPDQIKFSMEHKECAQYRDALARAKQELSRSFQRKEPINKIINRYTKQVDDIVIDIFTHFQCHAFCTLAAVGGYGRSELFPYSDLDILILTPVQAGKTQLQHIEKFIQCLWDCQIEVGHSVRTFEEVINIAATDITVISNLIDLRFLIGDKRLCEKLHVALGQENMWPNQAFYTEKMHEQEARYKKYGDSAFNLQPDIKQSPGGLRDLQTIGWITKRYFSTNNLRELMANQFLSHDEYYTLLDCQHFLWQVNLALQLHCGARQSRLLFDHQIEIAKILGFSDTQFGLGIEHFMKKYYRTIKTLRQLADMLLQILHAAIFHDKKTDTVILNERFMVDDQYLAIRDEHTFQNTPAALLELFVLLAKHPEIKGVSASTIRSIRENLYLINEQYRLNHQHTQLFMELLRQSINVSEQLQRMNLYGVLGRYIPSFGQVIGQMQYDLFHIYTVDEHTVYIVRNLRRFTLPTFYGKFPLCCEIIQTISKPEILYVAAFFHDLGKGRGGDHSQLGAADAKDFCGIHQISEEDTLLVTWLIEHHLLMSMTAQRKDIYDLRTINSFVSVVQTQRRLDHLYLLTVADICATNPSLWNSWRDSLLKELYLSAKKVLSQQQMTLDETSVSQEKQLEAREQLLSLHFPEKQINAFWAELPQTYFLREATANIVWQAAQILPNSEPRHATILLKPHHRQGGTEIFIYSKNNPYLFAKNCATISNLQLNIVEARIYTTQHRYALQCYVILDENNLTIRSEKRLEKLRHFFQNEYQISDVVPKIRKRLVPSTLRHFCSDPEFYFYHDASRDCTVLNISCPDRPGLLATISQIFLKCHVVLHTAKIATMGERIEDTFFISDEQGSALSQTEQQTLQKKLNEALLDLIHG